MEKIKQFFWVCAGAHIPFLEESKVESSKYEGIGATIFFTGLFAAIAASYALFTVFDNIWIAALFGLVWGALIFNLDRYIVSSMRKEGNPQREFRTALPRIILAVIISLVIAKPLEMKIFEKEIQSELLIMEQQTYTAQENEIRSRFQGDRQKLESEITALKNEIAVKTQTRNDLDRLAREEADGTGGTRQRNAGPIYQLKKKDADRAQLELDQLAQRNDALIAANLAAITTLDSTLAFEKRALTKQKLDGPASRMEALSRLTSKSDAIAWANWFIVLLFIAVETAPVFVKLISGQGPYDHLLRIEEYSFEGKRIEELARINTGIKKRSTEMPATEASYINERLDVKLQQS